ncbi:MAG TPA: TadE family protein [Terriglobales bacterium]|nr:TadE family protein [Terriglobales bacterium]
MRGIVATVKALRYLSSQNGAAIVEFAVSLPLLTVLVVGIFDFGGAVNLKQELNNAAREGARFGAMQPTNDLCSTNPCDTPLSIQAIGHLIDNYLRAAKINDCGLDAVGVSGTGPPYILTANSGCGGGTLTVTIYRDSSTGGGAPTCDLTATNYGGVAGPVDLPCTKVSISYPYQWHFNNVIQLIAPGSTYGLFIYINTDAVAVNTQ